METMTYRRQAKIATEKQSPFRPHRGLATPDLFLDNMLNQRIWETCLIDCTEALDYIYGTDLKHVARIVKLAEMLS
jgi:hypothetical protein